MSKTSLAASLVVAGMLVFPQAQADTPRYPAMAPVAQYMSASEADEITLARSAAPAAISAAAEILVLDDYGYEVAVKGSNGFVCFVMRSWGQDFDKAEFWNPKERSPQCINAAAARSVLPDYLTRTKWVLSGVSVADMLARTRAAVAAKQITAPEPGGISYMMSKNQYVNDASTHWHPHVMFFLPPTDGASVGASPPSSPTGSPVYASPSDVEPLTILFVVAPAWSDGTPGPAHN